MRKLVVTTEQDPYSATPGPGAVSAILDGGASRFRADHADPAARVTLGWTLDANEYRYLRAFYRTGTRLGSEPFLINLVMEGGALTEHVARFVVGTMELTSVSGLAYYVRARAEVRPRAQGA